MKAVPLEVWLQHPWGGRDGTPRTRQWEGKEEEKEDRTGHSHAPSQLRGSPASTCNTLALIAAVSLLLVQHIFRRPETEFTVDAVILGRYH
ncbi:hypothetical protein E2C01_039580 [Portunus trituberculatus]|uniref:Uncharacterized protein n=1 Tax=Portunus trituberculatus TaxID=210409 RepID=A0A5B7FNE8_PORTR|nr:hypothetical protein [Portunus trituberculatus]